MTAKPGPLDILAIESFAFSPHLETSAEVLLNSAYSKSTGFAFLHIENPDDINYSTSINPFAPRRKIKVRKCQNILGEKNVRILPQPTLNNSDIVNLKVLANSVSREIQTLADLMNYTYRGAFIGRGVASSLISKLENSEPDLDKNRELIQTYLLSALLAFEYTRLLIKTYSPKRVLTFNGRFAIARAIYEACLAESIQVLFHERGATPDRYYLSENRPHDMAKRRMDADSLWQKASADREIKGRSFFERRRNGDGLSWLSFTTEQTKNLVPTKKNKRRIAYFSSSDDEYAALGEVVKHPIFPNQRKAIMSLISLIANLSNTELVIRVHPNKKTKVDRFWWETLSGNNITVLGPTSPVDTYALIESSDIVVAYGSTVGIEASYWGKPAICLGDSFYGGFECVYEPKTENEILRLLKNDNLPPKSRESCLAYGYYMVTFGETYKYFKPEGLFDGLLCNQRLTPNGSIRTATIWLKHLIERNIEA